VRGVETADDFFSAPNVVIAAGAGARAVGRTAGVELPLVLRPRQSFTTPWRHPAFPADAPMLIGAPPFPHVRPEAQDGALFGWEYALNTRRYPENGQVADHRIEPLEDVNAAKDPRFPSLVLALLARQFGHAGGGFADTRYLRGIDHRAGHYVYRANAYRTLPDGTRVPYHSQRAIIDRWDGIDGLFLSVAHVGHGIMSAPAAGEILAARVLGQALPDPAFADFGLDVPYVEHDSGGISGKG
jgi:glycine/D-amino acid oxidase-like deaminating enzyme